MRIAAYAELSNTREWPYDRVEKNTEEHHDDGGPRGPRGASQAKQPRALGLSKPNLGAIYLRIAPESIEGTVGLA